MSEPYRTRSGRVQTKSWRAREMDETRRQRPDMAHLLNPDTVLDHESPSPRRDSQFPIRHVEVPASEPALMTRHASDLSDHQSRIARSSVASSTTSAERFELRRKRLEYEHKCKLLALEEEELREAEVKAEARSSRSSTSSRVDTPGKSMSNFLRNYDSQPISKPAVDSQSLPRDLRKTLVLPENVETLNMPKDASAVASERTTHWAKEQFQLKNSFSVAPPVNSEKSEVQGKDQNVGKDPICGPGSSCGSRSWIDSLDGEANSPPPVMHPAMQVPLMLTGLQDFMIDVFSGDPADWPAWSIDFKNKVHDCAILTTSQKLSILKKSLSEEPRSLVYSLLFDQRHYATVLKELEKRYGSKILVARAQIDKIRKFPVLRDSSGVTKFRAELSKVVHILRVTDMEVDLRSQTLLSELTAKLSQGMRESWGAHQRRTGSSDVGALLDWLSEKEEALRLGGGLDCSKGSDQEHSRGQSKSIKRNVNVVVNDGGEKSVPGKHSGASAEPSAYSGSVGAPNGPGTSKNDKKSIEARCSYCTKSHWLSECEVFGNMNPENRISWFKQEKRCFRCARKFHRTSGCSSRVTCKQCKGKHQTLLHEAFEHNTPRNDESTPEVERDNHAVKMNVPGVHLMTLPVRVYGPSGLYVDTSAMVDSGSQTSFISSSVAKTLNLKAPNTKLRLANIAQDIEPINSQCYRVKLGDPSNPLKMPISCDEIWLFDKELNLPSQVIPRQEDGSPAWEHISDLNLQDIPSEKIEILIGANCKELHRELSCRTGPLNLPDAVELAIGWCLRGTAQNEHVDQDGIVSVNHVRPVIVDEMSLNDMVENFWSTEKFGCRFNDEMELSTEDRYALDVLEKTIRLTPEGQYEVAMLWDPKFESLPYNGPQAVAKYHALRNRLSKNPEMMEKYRVAMNRNLEMGYARKLEPSEVNSRSHKSFVIPHHGVWNPAKGKMRPVFDAASKFAGKSLNDHLISGPDLANNVDGVKMRFRIGAVPMTADVEDMFCRVLVPKEDTDCLRYIWDPEFGTNPDTYAMQVHIFGAKCSPACANFAIRQTALDNRDSFPEKAIQSILDSTYVDDYMHAADSEPEAVETAKDVISILGKGGFKLTKWVSPSRAVLDAVSSTDGVTTSVDLDLEGSPMSKVLGLQWLVKDDCLGFLPKMIETTKFTKRGILSDLSSVYDPLNFLAPYLIRSRIIFQQLWHRKLDWDDELDVDSARDWVNWCSELVDLDLVSIPRKYWPSGLTPLAIELHVFVDSSEKAFCAVCYVRVVDDNSGEIHVAFVLARTRVAPVRRKTLTLPRLELQAAVLGVRLGDTVQRELRWDSVSVRYWSDSMTVLQYVNNESRRFKTFVSNRIAEIRAASEPSQWSYVPGEMNPADDGTRGLSVQEIASVDHRWLNGPSFLRSPEEAWPKNQNSLSPPDDDPEIKRSIFAMKKVIVALPTAIIDCTDYSTFSRLLRVTAMCLRFVYNLRQKCQSALSASEKRSKFLTGPISGAEMRDAKLYWFRTVQRERFSDELDALARDEKAHLHKSPLLPLLPFHDSATNLLRVSGRLDNALIPFDAKHQVILPQNHHITTLLLLDIHERMQHAGPASVAAQSRQAYWVIHCRAQVTKALKRCLHCRNLNAKTIVPRMAPLPPARVTGEHPVFHYCGVDYFGPIMVRERRSRVKRWVAIFTCLSVRAVHLEVVEDLSTDAYILAFRRFLGRRSEPAEIFSDNGTNFRGAVPELRESVRNLNRDEKFSSFLSKREIKFHFNPPRAPWMGGIWERLIGSVKRALKAVFKDSVVRGDVLTTSLVEIENTLNSRPLTTLSEDPSDPQPLTPRHLLAPCSLPQVTPQDVTEPSDRDCRSRWRRSQYMAQQFWQRWLKEYLPQLNVTSKWHRDNKPLKIDDVVILMDEVLPRGLWPLGRVTEVFLGRDNRVRSAMVQTHNGTYHRAASRLCFLEST